MKDYTEEENNLINYLHEPIDNIDENNISIKEKRCLQEIIKLAKYIYITSDKEKLLNPKTFTINPSKEKIKTKILSFNKKIHKNN